MDNTVPAGLGAPAARPGDDSRKLWQDYNKLRTEVIELRKLVVKRPPRPGGLTDGYGNFPFRIYQLPHELRPDISDPLDPAASAAAAAADLLARWRKFRVRCGRVDDQLLTGDGCDGYEFPDDDFYPINLPSNGTDPITAVVDIEVPADVVEYWFWIDLQDDGTPMLKHGDADSGGADNPVTQGWASFPVDDEFHIGIGFVNTDIYADERRALVRQLLREDLALREKFAFQIYFKPLTAAEIAENPNRKRVAIRQGYIFTQDYQINFTPDGAEGGGGTYDSFLIDSDAGVQICLMVVDQNIPEFVAVIDGAFGTTWKIGTGDTFNWSWGVGSMGTGGGYYAVTLGSISGGVITQFLPCPLVGDVMPFAMFHCGTYDAGRRYFRGNVVSSGADTYCHLGTIAHQQAGPTVGVAPPTAPWVKIS